MKRTHYNLIATLVIATAIAPATSAQPHLPDETATFTIPPAKIAQMSSSQWDAFGKRISRALTAQNAGVREAAMRGVIQYATHISFDRRAIISLARTYRNDENDNRRRMAVVALAATEDAWALDYLERSLPFERSTPVRHTVAAALVEAGIIGLGPARSSN
ncbi:MAG: hypothetical protein JJ896_05125 [Rhodothermales bacterium]|nr:hypothetical protein [Rhodothermales bacterium]MBO6779015.1 hypothetical protein [Rhodothermales bacterium]